MLQDLDNDNNFLNRTPIAEEIIAKIDKLDHIELKSFCTNLAQSARCVWLPALGKKPLATSLFFSFFLLQKKQKTEHQSESNATTSWTLSLWKVSLCHATLKQQHHLYPPGGYKAASVKLQKIQVSITHDVWLPDPFPTSGK
jgi:hypothetical protein